MKVIATKNVPKKWLKERKKDQAKLTTYWSTLYPEPYAELMTVDHQRDKVAAINASLMKMASDAKDVVFRGELRQTRDGFVYVDVPNSIFDGFLPLLGPEAEKPPKNERHYDDIGAHITVMKKKEVEENKIQFDDIGAVVKYTIEGVEKVENPDGWDEMEAVWFITVNSPELEKVRTKYNLPSRIKDHDFHITLGVKRRPVQDNTLV